MMSIVKARKRLVQEKYIKFRLSTLCLSFWVCKLPQLNIGDFKIYTKQEFNPLKYENIKLGNPLLTRIRVGRSFLNEHVFTIGLTDNPEC